jgi:carboxylesterase type B
VNVFLGIPYAEPPIGDLRFKRPLPVKQWSDPINAVNWPNSCPQIELITPFLWNKNFSEDCLYLNIWSPLISGSDELKPVMFWIHGGALLLGSSVQQHYSGEVLSTKGDVVVVSINYR